MDIRTDLHQVTVEIANARRIVADLEALRLLRRRRLSDHEAALATARIMLMSRDDAGTNDTQRRAYAELETAAERKAVTQARRELVEVEVDLTYATSRLRIAEDHRRYLETLVTLDAGRGAAESLHAAYADNGNGDGLGVLPTSDGDDGNLPF